MLSENNFYISASVLPTTVLMCDHFIKLYSEKIKFYTAYPFYRTAHEHNRQISDPQGRINYSLMFKTYLSSNKSIELTSKINIK